MMKPSAMSFSPINPINIGAIAPPAIDIINIDDAFLV